MKLHHILIGLTLLVAGAGVAEPSPLKLKTLSFEQWRNVDGDIQVCEGGFSGSTCRETEYPYRKIPSLSIDAFLTFESGFEATVKDFKIRERTRLIDIQYTLDLQKPAPARPVHIHKESSLLVRVGSWGIFFFFAFIILYFTRGPVHSSKSLAKKNPQHERRQYDERTTRI